MKLKSEVHGVAHYEFLITSASVADCVGKPDWSPEESRTCEGSV